MNEQQFYQELGQLPGPPPELFTAINRKIRRQGIIFRTMLALAATVVLAVGTTGILLVHNRTDQNLSAEVTDELQLIHSYLSGEDLDQVSQLYAMDESETE